MKPWLPLAGALVVQACSFPCDKTGDSRGTLQPVSGSGQLVVSCASRQDTRTFAFHETWFLYSVHDLEKKTRSFEVTLGFQGQNAPANLNFTFDRTLADGAYPLDGQSTAPVQTELTWMRSLEGTVSLARSRDVPFIDVSEPEPGEYATTVDLTLALTGQLTSYYSFDCPEPLQFTLLPSTVHLEKHTTVGTCDGGDVLEGLSNARLGH
ncbi:hypothetical protein [Stigmatella erecta]|nr:hypothetical protein [Stigmatella erecta]